VNSAVAMQVASATVEIDAGSPPAIWVDKQPVQVTDGQALPLAGGGQVWCVAVTCTVEWPDGSKALVFPFGF
jgi:hypothetical protein